MEWIAQGWTLLLVFADFFIHLDRHLAALVANYGAWVYLILFLIIFCETGLVVTPFLPGDSLLFLAGALAALGGMNVHLLVVILVAAAILGDATNYAVGRFFGARWLARGDGRFIKKKHLDLTHAYYEQYGGATLVVARFVPIVRTYAPFVAGLGLMTYPKFSFYNITGALVWVVSLVYIGYFFGNVPWVKANTGLVVLAIIGLSLVPLVLGILKARKAGVAPVAPR